MTVPGRLRDGGLIDSRAIKGAGASRNGSAVVMSPEKGLRAVAAAQRRSCSVSRESRARFTFLRHRLGKQRFVVA